MENNPFKKGDLVIPSKSHISVALEGGKVYTILAVDNYLVTVRTKKHGKTKYHYSWLTPAPKIAYLKHYLNG